MIKFVKETLLSVLLLLSVGAKGSDWDSRIELTDGNVIHSSIQKVYFLPHTVRVFLDLEDRIGSFMESALRAGTEPLGSGFDYRGTVWWYVDLKAEDILFIHIWGFFQDDDYSRRYILYKTNGN